MPRNRDLALTGTCTRDHNHGMFSRSALSSSEVDALLVLSLVWTVLLAKHLSAPWLGNAVATLVAFSLATIITLTTRRSENARSWSSACLVWGAALAAGGGAYLVSASLAAHMGLFGGIIPHSTPLRGPNWVSAVVLAPVFEELLYRERLLPPIRDRVGSAGAVVLTSLLFAIPHLHVWSMIGAFFTGIALGTAMHLRNSIAMCIGLHMGWNLLASFGTRSLAP